MIENETRNQSTMLLEWSSTRRAYLLAKRIFDIVLSLVLLVVSVPVLLCIAMAIKLDSPGPTVVRQKRIGQWGKHFWLYRFRTMERSLPPSVHREVREAIFKMRNDPRMTAVGRFVRRTSLEELPQLLNVLKGEMSIVGPRPMFPWVSQLLPEEARRARLQVKPGMTGLWQANPLRYGGSYEEMVRADLEYLRRASLGIDLTILVKTVVVVIRGKGAY